MVVTLVRSRSRKDLDPHHFPCWNRSRIKMLKFFNFKLYEAIGKGPESEPHNFPVGEPKPTPIYCIVLQSRSRFWVKFDSQTRYAPTLLFSVHGFELFRKKCVYVLFSKMHPHFKPIKIKKNAVCSSSKSYIS
jgi:hypothetical protein